MEIVRNEIRGGAEGFPSFFFINIGIAKFFHYICNVEDEEEIRGRKVPLFRRWYQTENMIDCKKIAEAATRRLEGTDLFVVGCTSTPANEVELLLDSDTSVSLEACVALSRAIEEEFDRDEEDFQLTVASAGIGNELKCLRQYRKLTGSPVEVLLTSGIKLLARLERADESGITLSYEEKQAVEGKKKKTTVTVTRDFTYPEIKYTKEYLDFK